MLSWQWSCAMVALLPWITQINVSLMNLPAGYRYKVTADCCWLFVLTIPMTRGMANNYILCQYLPRLVKRLKICWLWDVLFPLVSLDCRRWLDLMVSCIFISLISAPAIKKISQGVPAGYLSREIVHQNGFIAVNGPGGEWGLPRISRLCVRVTGALRVEMWQV